MVYTLSGGVYEKRPEHSNALCSHRYTFNDGSGEKCYCGEYVGDYSYVDKRSYLAERMRTFGYNALADKFIKFEELSDKDLVMRIYENGDEEYLVGGILLAAFKCNELRNDKIIIK